ncbi:radical SAM protein [Acetivibrio cellulolyticus]|uniref:radical SAM protein n=1 Tax=Acetivibrio cellulolyticus TaxID=35830 RepID=UPI0001E2FB45|nr:radical SAM protein [Acetivibrio cellulolyticus]
MDIKATPYSNLKLFAHSDKLDAIKKGIWTAPIYIRIKPTNACNHHCNYCHYGNGQYLNLDGQDERNHIPWEKMQEIVEDIGDMGVKAITFSGGGEPLVYPYIIQTMKAMLNRNIELSIITNGHKLNGEIAEILTNAKWVRISLDSANAETYSKIRNISLDSFGQVCKNINMFAKAKPDNCELGINFVINRDNYDQVYEAGKLMFNLGVNHIKYAARITTDVNSYHAPIRDKVIEQINRVKDEFENPKFKVINLYEDDFHFSSVFQRSYTKCIVTKAVTVIAADSKVYFCHDKAYLENGIIGDLKNRSFKELWFSPETQEKYKNFDASKECKHHCVYDSRNILLNTFLSLDENHINFI